MKPCLKTFILKVWQNFDFLTEKKQILILSNSYSFKFQALKNSIKKVPCSLGSRHGRLKEAAWRGWKNKGNFFENCFFQPLQVKISKKWIKYMQKFSQFYVTYRNIVQFDHDLGKVDYFEKSVLKLMAGPVAHKCTVNLYSFSQLNYKAGGRLKRR